LQCSVLKVTYGRYGIDVFGYKVLLSGHFNMLMDTLGHGRYPYLLDGIKVGRIGYGKKLP